MTVLVFFLLVFTAVAVVFLFFHLVLGSFFRPARPEREKLTIYECGEPTVGSAWIQFDLRYYVVALLFVIFDVEVAFFFPWAVVFGHANQLARTDLPKEKRAKLTAQLQPWVTDPQQKKSTSYFPGGDPLYAEKRGISPSTAQSWAWVAFVDILVFFGVLMVGFAYLWRRGDINWVRSVAAEKTTAAPPEGLPAQPAAGLMVASKN